MINVSDATKAAFLNSSTQKTILIEFPNLNMVLSNEDIVSESFSLTQTLESERNLSFKGCNASQVKFQAAEIAEDLRGQLMTVTIQAGNTEPIKLFTGFVESQSNLTQEDFITDIVAYDAFYKMSNITIENFKRTVPYYGTVFWFYFNHDIGLRDILKYLDDNFGLLGYNENKTYYDNLIETTERKFFNDWRSGVYDPEQFQAVNGSMKLIEVMRYLCQSIGVYGYIDGNGLLNFKELTPFNRGTYPGQNTIPADNLYPAGENTDLIFDQSDYISARYEPYDVEKISALKLHLPSGKTSIFYEPQNNKILDYGSDSFRIAFSSLYQNEAAKARVSKIWYKPSMIKVVGRPWVEVGDSYIYTTRRNVVRSYVLKRTLKGIQSLFDTYEADGEDTKDYDVFETGSGTNIEAMSLSVGTGSDDGYITVNGHTVTFKNVTISGTTYHLLGYTD